LTIDINYLSAIEQFGLSLSGALAECEYLSMLSVFNNPHWKNTEKLPGSSMWLRKPQPRLLLLIVGIVLVICTREVGADLLAVRETR
jgi:hypothetical protein